MEAVIVRRLGLPAEQQQKLASKAAELVRLSTAKLGAGGLGQGELCKGAACVELAAMALGVTVDASLVQRLSGVNDKVYRNAKAALQKILGVGSRATARELCVQFGCARHHDGVRACLAAFKERFVRSLPAVQQGHVDFSRAVFLAAAFYLVARKHKVAVDRMKLLGPLGVTATEFSQVAASMADLCHDLVGTEARKRRAEDLPEQQRALVERTGGGADEGGEASDSGDEVEDEGQVGHRLNPKKQRQREYEEWKAKMTAKPAEGGAAGGKKKEALTEKKLRQATLSFAAAPAAGAAAAAAQGAAEEQGGSEPAAAADGSKEGSSSKGPAKAKAATAAGKQGRGGRSGSSSKAALASKNS